MSDLLQNNYLENKSLAGYSAKGLLSPYTILFCWAFHKKRKKNPPAVEVRYLIAWLIYEIDELGTFSETLKSFRATHKKLAVPKLVF